MPPKNVFQVEVGRSWVSYAPDVNTIISNAYDRRMKSVDIKLPMGLHTVYFDTMTQGARGKKTLKVRTCPKTIPRPVRTQHTRARAPRPDPRADPKVVRELSTVPTLDPPVVREDALPDDDIDMPRKTLFKKALGKVFNSRNRSKPDADESAPVEEDVGLSDLSRAAMQYLRRVQSFCDRLKIQPAELYRSHVASLDSARAPCCSSDSFCRGLASADASLHVSDTSVLLEIYKAARGYCLQHKTNCVTREKFVEAVEFGNVGAPRKSRTSRKSHRYGSSPDVARLSSSSAGSPESRNTTTRERTSPKGGTPLRTIRRRDKGRHREPRTANAGLPGGASLPPRAKPDTKKLSASTGASVFTRLGGDERSQKITKKAFFNGMEAEAKRGRPCDVEAIWRKLDPMATGEVHFKDFHSALKEIKERPLAPSAKKTVGLTNLGNTCYMNAALQCLQSCRGLTELLLDAKFVRTQINPDGVLGSKGEIALVYCKLLRRLKDSTKISESPRDFKAVVGKKNSEYAGKRQQDSQEFIGFLLDMLHEDLNRVKSKPYVEHIDITPEKIYKLGFERCAAEEWYNYLKRDNSVIVDSFQGQLKSMMKCKLCEYAVTKFEPFMFLSVPTICQDGKKITSLLDGVSEYSKDEELTGQNQWYCPQCQKLRDAKKTMHVWKLPKYLVVHLKRFHITENVNRSKSGLVKLSKVTHDVDVALEMSFSNVVHPQSVQKCPPDYRLQAFLQHVGSESSGHYTACTRLKDDTWQLCDDDTVTMVNNDALLKRAAVGYVYVFERRHGYGQANSRSLCRQSPSNPDLWPHVVENGRTWSFVDR